MDQKRIRELEQKISTDYGARLASFAAARSASSVIIGFRLPPDKFPSAWLLPVEGAYLCLQEKGA